MNVNSYFAQISSETTLNEFVDFDAETNTSETAADPVHLDWRKCAEKKSIAEILQSEDTILINDSDGEIVDDEQDIRKMMASAALDSLDAVKCFAEIQEDKQMNVMPN